MLSHSRRSLAALAAALLAAVTGRKAQAAPTGIVGTWKVVDATARTADGQELAKPYGPLGMGLVTFNDKGRMMAVLCDGRPAMPEGVARDYSSYCGNYTFDGATLVTRVDASSAARLAVGGDQVRKVRFDGERLVLMPPPAPVDGVMVQRHIYWERISPVSA
jgi:hypothetical protein